MNIVEYSLFVFFWYYLINNSDIAKPYRDKWYPKLHPNVTYAIKCSLCMTFWVSLIIYLINFIVSSINIPWYFIFVAPVINIFVYRLFNFLGMEVHSSP